MNEQILILKELLEKENIPCKLSINRDGWNVSVKIGEERISVLQNDMNLGHDLGFMEIMGGMTVEELEEDCVKGLLTYDEVFYRIKWCYENKSIVFSNNIEEFVKKELYKKELKLLERRNDLLKRVKDLQDELTDAEEKLNDVNGLLSDVMKGKDNL